MNKNINRGIILLLQGILVGFGAIMPGISGGTLCVAFGMYKPILEVLSNPKTGLKNHWKSLVFFILGGGIGFIGLSGLASWLMLKNSLVLTCVFIGFILGTIPDLWKDAGKCGRKKSSYTSLIIGFAIMLGLLLFLKSRSSFSLQPNIGGFLLCGILWGLSFIVPGLSSSTLLLFFGLYQPMLDGIAKLSPKVLIPLVIGVCICFLTLPKIVNRAFEKYYATISHCIIGIVIATTVSIIPTSAENGIDIIYYIIAVIGGAIATLFIGKICSKLDVIKEATKQEVSA